ncbi:[acyl-carrier-protein] S-malonyltransferase [Peptoniphilus olsenii]|uniref:Malonyl CoA-acyl carrier protein transacylase n=1 Tax=Peptoniphilus olsenii TaxID=411570 RepID=A0ABV2J800_9FIRM
MSKTAIVFGGQGSQYKNMGEKFLCMEIAKPIYKNIKEYHKIIKDDDILTLSMTENLQPIMLAFQLAALEIIKSRMEVHATCGLSLGEYSSLVTSKVLNVEEALNLVKHRARLMANEAKKIDSAMLVVFNKSESELKSLLTSENLNEKVFISNINSPRQVVLAGEKSSINKMKNIFKNLSIKNISLEVSGAFHTNYMKNAAKKYTEYLEDVKFNRPKCKYYLNLTGQEYNDENFVDLLSKHITSPVRLFSCISNMINDKVTKVVEIGPGSVISNIIKKYFKEIEVISLKNEDEIIEFGRR